MDTHPKPYTPQELERASNLAIKGLRPVSGAELMGLKALSRITILRKRGRPRKVGK